MQKFPIAQRNIEDTTKEDEIEQEASKKEEPAPEVKSKYKNGTFSGTAFRLNGIKQAISAVLNSATNEKRSKKRCILSLFFYQK